MNLKKTKTHSQWWKNRKIDWKTSYLDTWDHPHRLYLANKLAKWRWASLFEVGCGAGANELLFSHTFPYAALGGCDVSPEAIKVARSAVPHGVFDIASGDNVFMSDKSVDLILTDMCLIYVDASEVGKYLKEMKRVGRHRIVLVEFYHPSWWKRLKMTWAGRHTHNYPKLLEKLGCFDVTVDKMPETLWPGAHDNEYRYIISARLQ